MAMVVEKRKRLLSKSVSTSAQKSENLEKITNRWYCFRQDLELKENDTTETIDAFVKNSWVVPGILTFHALI